MQKSWRRNIVDGLQKGLGFSLAVLSIAITLLFVYYFILFDKLNVFMQKYVLLSQNNSYNSGDLVRIQGLINKGLILPAKDVLDYSVKYYDTFITILVSLLGLGAFLGYLYIKVVTRKEAERNIYSAVSDYFEKQTTVNLIKVEIARQVGEWSSDVDEIATKVNSLQEQIELIRSTQPITEEITQEDNSGSN